MSAGLGGADGRREDDAHAGMVWYGMVWYDMI